MPIQPGLCDAMKKKGTRRVQFLAEMDAVVFWAQVLVPIVPHYPKVEPKGGRPPVPLENMLRMYCLQNCYALSDPIAGETLWESDAIRQFAGTEWAITRTMKRRPPSPSGTFWSRRLTEALFAETSANLPDKGITLRSGTLVYTTIINAPSSTKNEAKVRDPDMPPTRKGNDW